MKKYLHFVNTNSDHNFIPASTLVEMEMDSSGTALDLRFDCQGGGASGAGAEAEIELTINDNKGKEVMEAIAKEIRSGKQPLITVADDLNSEYIHSDITAVGSLAGLRIL
jgi:hypothetical protein